MASRKQNEPLVAVTKDRIAEVRKLLVFVVTVVANAVALGVVPEDFKVWALLVLNTAGAYGIYRVPNRDA